MYVILVNDDNTLSTTKKERIVKGSKLVDTLWVLVNPVYQNQDMSNATVTMEYVLPISRKYGIKFLRLAEEGYQDYLKYMLPEEDEIDSDFTSEAGRIEVKLTFTYVSSDSNGKVMQHVRKTTTTTITVVPNANWGDLIPDPALEALDQRLIKMDAQSKMLGEYAEFLSQTQVDNLRYDDSASTLQLTSGGYAVGDAVNVRDMIDEGIPVVTFGGEGSDSNGSDNSNNGDSEHKCDCNCDCGDNVVEFGGQDVPNEETDDDNVVEF